MNRGTSTDSRQLCDCIADLDRKRNQSFSKTFPEMALLLDMA